MAVNKAIILGYVGKDPEVKHLESGIVVATFPLATTERAYTLLTEHKFRKIFHRPMK